VLVAQEVAAGYLCRAGALGARSQQCGGSGGGWQTGGPRARRWAEGARDRGGEPGGDAADAAAEARRSLINAEVKRTLTSLLLEVTDAMFGAPVLTGS